MEILGNRKRRIIRYGALALCLSDAGYWPGLYPNLRHSARTER